MMRLMSVGCHGGSTPLLTARKPVRVVVCVRFHKVILFCQGARGWLFSHLPFHPICLIMTGFNLGARGDPAWTVRLNGYCVWTFGEAAYSPSWDEWLRVFRSFSLMGFDSPSSRQTAVTRHVISIHNFSLVYYTSARRVLEVIYMCLAAWMVSSHFDALPLVKSGRVFL